MAASFLRALRSGPPPPKVVLLPDALFFTRSVPVAAGASAAEAASQIELALEAVAPFPLAQMFYGWFWSPGSEQALVYAAYRRRFPTEQTAAWADAELVLPVSAALLGAQVQPATTVVLAAPDSFTAVHWTTPELPPKILSRPIEAEATDEQRIRLRDELLAAMGGSKTVVDLVAAPVPEAGRSDRELVFRADELVSRLPAAVVASLDVRDKGDLAALRAARQRDIVLWRVALGCAAALGFLLLGQLALVGGNSWQKSRAAFVEERKDPVNQIKKSQELATKIADLVNKRLLPLEMLTLLVGVDNKWKPEDIVLTRVEANDETDGLYTLRLEVQTTNPQALTVYEGKIKSLPEVESVSISNPRTSAGNLSISSVTVTFKPDVIKPTTSA